MMSTDTMETLREDWATFEAAVKEIHHGDLETFRRVNQTLGYNLAKAVPILLRHQRDLEREIHNLEVRNRALAGQVEAGEKALTKAANDILLYKCLNKSLQDDLIKASTPEQG